MTFTPKVGRAARRPDFAGHVPLFLVFVLRLARHCKNEANVLLFLLRALKQLFVAKSIIARTTEHTPEPISLLK
jgi:hypothetical protein